MSSTTLKLFLLVISAFAIVKITMAGDANILTDFIVPEDAKNIDAKFFTFTGMRVLVENFQPPTVFKSLKANMTEFPAINGQGVSYSVLQYPGGTLNPPHIHFHPRGAELLLVTQGSLQVGFVDTTNKLFTQKLQPGDMFLVPKGLVHFTYNADPNTFALAIAAFGSANAGAVKIPNTLFNTSIDNNAALAFKTDVATIQCLKKGFAP